MAIDKLAMVWPDWKAVEMIGEGSLAKVYKAVNTVSGEESAIKVISLPRDGELDSLRAEGMDDVAIKAYYAEMVEDIKAELEINRSLGDCPNVVDIYDMKTVAADNGIGCDIYIRMELLVPFANYTALYPLTEADSIKMAADICTALEACEKKGIIHRDIKPESIMISADGSFKLSDFTITKDGGRTGSVLSNNGGFVYLAPEIARGGQYDCTADIYSLGLLLYKLNNNGCMPFINPNLSEVSFAQRKEALDRRMSGESLPLPCNASSDYAQVILAACAYDPAKRFQSASALKMILEKIAPTVGIPIIAVDYNTMVGERSAVLNPTAPTTEFESDIFEIDDDPVVGFNVENTDRYDPPLRNQKKKNPGASDKNKTKLIIILSCAGGALLIIVAILLFILLPGPSSSDSKAEISAIITSLRSDEFDKADKLYDDYAGNMDQLRGELKKRLDEIYSEFLAVEGAYDDAYDAAIAEIDTIDGFGDKVISEKISETRQKVEDLCISRRSFDQGRAFLTNKQYAEAIEAYNKVVKDDPNYEEAQKLREEAIEPYREQVCDDAQISADDSRYEEAVEFLKKALELLPEDEIITEKLDSIKDQYADEVIAEADKYIEEGDTKSANDVLVAALELLEKNDKIEDKLETLANEVIKISDAYIDDGDFDAASKTLKDALEYLKDNPKILDAIEALDTKMENYYIRETDELITDKKYTDALKMMALAYEKLSESENILKKHEEIEDVIIKEAEGLISSGKFEDAEKLLNTAIESLQSNDKLSKKLNGLTSDMENYYLKQADDLLAENDLTAAAEVISDGLKVISDSQKLKDKQKHINTMIENDYIERADAAMNSYDYYGALDILKQGEKILPDSTAISDKIDDLKANAPDDLDDISCNGYDNVSYYNESVKDEKGNSYTKYASFSTRSTAYAEYDLDGDYDMFVATLFTTNTGEKTVRIYLDGSSTPAFSLENFDDETKPRSIELNVTGVKTMRIEVEVDALIMSKSVIFGEPLLY